MTTGPAVQSMPREQAKGQYEQQNEQRYRQQVDEELQYKHDKRSNLVLGRGKSLVLSSPSGTTQALGLDNDGFITVTDYATGAVGTLIVQLENVNGLVQEFIDVRAEFAAADGGLSASVTAEAIARADADTAIAGTVTTLAGRVTTNEGDITTLDATATAIDGRLVTVESDYATATSFTTLTARVEKTSASLLPKYCAYQDDFTFVRPGDPATIASATGSFSASVVTDTDMGPSLRLALTAAGNNLLTKGVLPIVAGRIYQVRIRFKVSTLPGDGTARFRPLAVGLDASYTNVANEFFNGTPGSVIDVSDTGVKELIGTIGDNTTVAQAAWPGSGSVQIRMGIRLDVTEAVTIDVQSIEFTDITDREALEASVTTNAADIVTQSSAIADLEANKAEASTVSTLSASVDTLTNDVDAIAWDDVAYFWDWSSGTANGWTPTNSTLSYPGDGSVLVTQSGGSNDVYIQSAAISVDGSRYYKVIVDLECVTVGTLPVTADYSLYYTTAGHSYSGSYRDLPRESCGIVVGARKLQIYDMDEPSSGGTDWITNTITRIRIDTPQAAGSQWKIHSVRIVAPTTTGALRRISLAEADIVTEQSARASGDSANATSITNLTASFVGRTYLNANPFFDEGPAATGVPAQWASWSNGGSMIVEAKPWVASGLHMRSPPITGTPNVGVQITPLGGVTPENKYKVRAEVALLSGTYVAAGVLIYWYNAAGSYMGVNTYIKFATDADSSGTVSTTAAGRRVFEKLITAPALATGLRLYAMTAYSSFGTRQATSPEMRWFECSISAVETSLAQVTNIAEAYATDSASTARLVWTVNTGTNVATIEQTAAEGYDDGTWNGSAISLTADEIILDGDVIITGTLTTGALEANAVTNSQVSQTAGSISLTSGSYVTVASFSFTSVGIGVELRSSCDVTLTNLAPVDPSRNILWRVRRGSTVLKSGTLVGIYTSTDLGGGIFQTAVNGTVQADYNDIPSSGTYTYDLQIQITNTGGTPASNALNRFLSGREFKR